MKMNRDELVAKKKKSLERNVNHWIMKNALFDPNENYSVTVIITKLPLPTPEVSIEIHPQTETFNHRSLWYYGRQLTAQEMREIASLEECAWRQAIIDFFIKNENQETLAADVYAISNDKGFQCGSISNWLTVFNSRLSTLKFKFRLTYPKKRAATDTSLLRFYRIVDKQ